MIIVGRKHHPKAQYIGRGSPLGNPFVMKSEKDRDRVCNLYSTLFHDRVRSGDPAFCNELRRLLAMARAGDLTLGCFCAPRRCHGDTIKEFLDSVLTNEVTFE